MDEVVRITLPHDLRIATVRQHLRRVCANSLEHAIPRLASRGIDNQQPTVEQCLQRIEEPRSMRADYSMSSGQIEATLKEHQTIERLLLSNVEKPMGPVDRGAQRLVMLRQVARAAGQKSESILETAQQRPGRQELDARRGELDLPAAAHRGAGKRPPRPAHCRRSARNRTRVCARAARTVAQRRIRPDPWRGRPSRAAWAGAARPSATRRNRPVVASWRSEEHTSEL